SASCFSKRHAQQFLVMGDGKASTHIAMARAHIARAVEEVEAARSGRPASTEAEPARATFQCVDCGVSSPEAAGEYTLISSRFGWRLSRSFNNGVLLLEWRCPTCWARQRQRAQTTEDESPPSSRVRPLREPPPGARGTKG